MRTGAGGTVAVSVSDGRVKVDHAVRAIVGEGANFNVGSLALLSERNSRATGTMTAGAGGLVTVTTGGSISEIAGTVESRIGRAVGASEQRARHHDRGDRGHQRDGPFGVVRQEHRRRRFGRRHHHLGVHARVQERRDHAGLRR